MHTVQTTLKLDPTVFPYEAVFEQMVSVHNRICAEYAVTDALQGELLGHMEEAYKLCRSLYAAPIHFEFGNDSAVEACDPADIPAPRDREYWRLLSRSIR